MPAFSSSPSEPAPSDPPADLELEQDDPAEPLPADDDVTSSLRPIPAAEFGEDEARHLLWRAGFGGNAAQIATLAEWGPEKAVDYLLDYDGVAYEPARAGAFDKDIIRPIDDEDRGELARARRSNDERILEQLRVRRQEAQRNDRQQIRDIQQWWLTRMIETPRPMEEKLTLFWHGHFATSYRTIEDSYHLYQQNQFFRANAAGSFAKLLAGIIRDPAMIAYLDNNDSRKDKPNENLARELMELFSLGVGNYAERDIKEGARALTGYTFDDDEFVFRQRNHDYSAKTILGASGNLDGEGFVSAILRKRDCARFIAAKLYRSLAAHYPTGRAELDDAAKSVIREMGVKLYASKYQLRPMLRRLLLSRHFYSPAVMREQIKNPVELIVGAVRSLNTPARDVGVLVDACNLMGQNLFFPPSVKGWEGGRAWINTSTLFVRQNALCYLLTGTVPGRGPQNAARAGGYDAGPLLDDLARLRTSAAGATARLAERLLRLTLGAASDRAMAAITPVLGNMNIDSRDGAFSAADNAAVTRALLLITAMPEYQLC